MLLVGRGEKLGYVLLLKVILFYVRCQK